MQLLITSISSFRTAIVCLVVVPYALYVTMPELTKCNLIPVCFIRCALLLAAVTRRKYQPYTQNAMINV